MTQEEVFKLRQSGNEVQRILDAESTMAEQTERAVAAAEAAAEDAHEVNEALQEIVESGDIPSATIAKVAEHTLEIADLEEKKADKNGYYQPMRVGALKNPSGEIIMAEQTDSLGKKNFNNHGDGTNYNDRFGRMHGSMGNVLFADLHVEAIKDIQEEQVPNDYVLPAWK